MALLSASLAGAQTTYYVSTSGSDSNQGTSAQPFRTITHAYTHAAPGVTIIVEPGTYTDFTSRWGLLLASNGTASSPIVLRSETPGAAIIDGQTREPTNADVYINGSYNVVDGFEIKNAPRDGIAVFTGHHNQILNCEIDANGLVYGGSGIYEDETSSGNWFGGNYIRDNGASDGGLDHGLYLTGDDDVVINNICARNTGSGLQIAGYATVSNMKVYNNVFAWNGTDGIIIWQPMNGVDIKNNISYANTYWGVYFLQASGSGVVIDDNLVYGNGLGNYNDPHNGGGTLNPDFGTTISSDPQFVDETQSGFDAHLTTNSPAIGVGYNFYTIFTTDFDGTPRPSSGNWDIGAYVFASVTNNIYYVATSGSDTNPGTYAQPFRTITYAYSLAVPGTTITVMTGTYTDYTSGYGLNLASSGTASSPIVLQSYVRGGALIDGGNASDRNKGISISGDYNIVNGFEVENGPNGGIAVYGNGNQILNCEVDHNGTLNDAEDTAGIAEDSGLSGNWFEGNYIHDNGDVGASAEAHGLDLSGQNDVVINNVCARNTGTGLQISGNNSTVSNMIVYNNVFAWNTYNAVTIWGDMNGVDIENNILYANVHWGVHFLSVTGAGVVIDDNIIYGNGSGDHDDASPFQPTFGTTISSDPQFANDTQSGFDAHLTGTSPAIGAGYNFYSLFTTDLAGNPRPASGAWDLGAYKY